MKNIFITGISRGLGLKMTQFLLDEGSYNVYGISRSSSSELDELIRKYPDKLHWKLFDLTHLDEIENNLFSSFMSDDIPLYAFINNAGVHYVDLIPRMSSAKILEQITVNLNAPLLITKLIIKNFLIHKTKGSIIHISSISAHGGTEGLAAYSAAKGGLEAFSRCTAREFGKRGIRSNVLVLGLLSIGMGTTVPSNISEAFVNNSALREYTGYNSVLNMIDLLLSERAASITGHNINIDSGTI